MTRQNQQQDITITPHTQLIALNNCVWNAMLQQWHRDGTMETVAGGPEHGDGTVDIVM